MARILVGLSGGVDSAVAAYLLQRQGHEVEGLFLHLWSGDHPRSCCSREALRHARTIAEILGIPLHVRNAEDAFRELVVRAFREGYRAGETPNPCITCNRELRFPLFLETARALGADSFATGHYVRLRVEEEVFLLRGRDAAKDQSYFLYALPSDAWRFLRFPVGEFTKAEVRALARSAGLEEVVRQESMDLCFFQGQVEQFFPRRWVRFVDLEGRLLAEEERFWFFAVGQRRGLGVATGRRLYVREVQPEGTVVLAPYEALFAEGVRLEQVHWVAPPRERSFRATVKHRNTAPLHPARIHPRGDALLVEFPEPLWGPAVGQSLVIYEGERVLAGGTIREVAWTVRPRVHAVARA